MGEIAELPTEAVEPPKAPTPVVSSKKEDPPQTNEQIRKETIDEIVNQMFDVPKPHDYGDYKIPYRQEKPTVSENRVYDRESGLYLKATYKPMSSLSIILSTPNLLESSNFEQDIENMRAALKQIYGESPELEAELQKQKATVLGKSRDRIAFALQVKEKAEEDEIYEGFSAVDDEEIPALRWGDSDRRTILDSGGILIKEILGRVAQQQTEDYRNIVSKIDEIVERSKPEAVEVDESTAKEYAYHATDRVNMPSISELGLQPSGSRSREPGTIWVTGWNGGVYNFDPSSRTIYRFHIPDFPDIVERWKYDYDPKDGLVSDGSSLRRPIPPNKLEFSLDSGKTWMPVVPKGQSAQALPKAE